MVTITFPDRETEVRALAYLLGRFAGRVLKSGEHVLPEAALRSLADQGIPFAIQIEAAALSEPAPAADWNRPEEDAAWLRLQPPSPPEPR